MRPDPFSRRGASLVELLGVIAVGSVIIGLVGVCLQGMYRAEQRTRQHMTRRAAVTQLSWRLRADAHEATQAELTAPPQTGVSAGLVLTAPDGRTITYRTADAQIERTVRQGERTLHHDAFRLPGVRTAWQLETAGRHPLATLVIAHLPEPGLKPVETELEERIESIVGLQQKP